jgi:hypothetical protein
MNFSLLNIEKARVVKTVQRSEEQVHWPQIPNVFLPLLFEEDCMLICFLLRLHIDEILVKLRTNINLSVSDSKHLFVVPTTFKLLEILERPTIKLRFLVDFEVLQLIRVFVATDGKSVIQSN